MTTAEKIVSEVDKTAPEKRKALGRGLDSLLPGGPRMVGTATVASPSASSASPSTAAVATPPMSDGRDAVVQIPIAQIEGNPYQTRYRFADHALDELANSIRANGVVQPVVVRPAGEGRYLLI